MIFEILSPVGYLAGFTVALHGLIDTGAHELCAVSGARGGHPVGDLRRAAYRRTVSAGSYAGWVHDRLATLPIAAAVPVGARMVATLIRAALALSVAMVAGYAFGFRMTGGLGYALAFVLITLLLCLAVALGADALGSQYRAASRGPASYWRPPSCCCLCCPPESRRRKPFPAGYARTCVTSRCHRSPKRCAAWPAGGWQSATSRPAWPGVGACCWSSARSRCDCRGGPK